MQIVFPSKYFPLCIKEDNWNGGGRGGGSNNINVGALAQQQLDDLVVAFSRCCLERVAVFAWEGRRFK
jgi:hypothetical protein